MFVVFFWKTSLEKKQKIGKVFLVFILALNLHLVEIDRTICGSPGKAGKGEKNTRGVVRNFVKKKEINLDTWKGKYL